MPYPASHRIAVRNKIVHSARRLFNRHGFDNVSISQIMAGAGLTHGGFYSYFSSKSDLYTEVLGCFFTDPNWKSCWEDVEVDLAAVDAGAQVVRAYLSRQHFEDVDNSCPMVALPSDVTRSGKGRRRAFQTVFQAMVRVLERSSSGNGRPRATHRPRLLCAWAAWWWLGPCWTALLRTNCAMPAWLSHFSSGAGTVSQVPRLEIEAVLAPDSGGNPVSEVLLS